MNNIKKISYLLIFMQIHIVLSTKISHERSNEIHSQEQNVVIQMALLLKQRDNLMARKDRSSQENEELHQLRKKLKTLTATMMQVIGRH